MLLYHPLINPSVNLAADILLVNGIPKLVVANEEADAAAGSLTLSFFFFLNQRYFL
jgi:hypothetical protein